MSTPEKLKTFTRSSCFFSGALRDVFKMPLKAASKPVDHILDLKPSHSTANTGMPSSALISFATE